MHSIAEVLFWVCLAIIIYTYAGYPLVLLILTGLKKIFLQRRPLSEVQAPPPVSLIIAAYNEEDIILQKIRNTSELDYPANCMDVIFITDGSTDKTSDIIAQFPEFRLLSSKERRGKLAAMNRAIEEARHNIVIFSDANGYLNSTAIREMVRHYNDPRVGAVSGEKKVINASGTIEPGEGLYWKYESFLKKCDSDLYSVIGAAGELFSIRKDLYTRLPEHLIIEDFVQSLLLCKRGYVVRYEPRAYSAEYPPSDVRDEIQRKIRISAGGFQALVYLRSLFNFFKYPALSFLFISHRVLRWTLAPASLPVVFLATWTLYFTSGGQEWLIFGTVQLIFGLLGLAGWLLALNGRKMPVVYVCFYFLLMNFCVFAGFYRYLLKQQKVTWHKASRAQKI